MIVSLQLGGEVLLELQDVGGEPADPLPQLLAGHGVGVERPPERFLVRPLVGNPALARRLRAELALEGLLAGRQLVEERRAYGQPVAPANSQTTNR
eukprot:772626-Prorocentrum_minimum.AAC.1